MSRATLLAAAMVSFTLVSAGLSRASAEEPDRSTRWVESLAEMLRTYGHRNWIVVVDMAYPAQSSPGIQMLHIRGDQLSTVHHVIQVVRQAKHVRGRVYLDAELEYVPEQDAPGVTQYRNELKQVLGQNERQVLPHEEIIKKLDEAAKLFNVLVLKTDATIPYTSVFIELDCGYWNAEAEKRLREAMKAKPRSRN